MMLAQASDGAEIVRLRDSFFNPLLHMLGEPDSTESSGRGSQYLSELVSQHVSDIASLLREYAAHRCVCSFPS